jgi:hypothetical protein
VGWYLSFYAGWSHTRHPFITYDNVTQHTEETLIELSQLWGIKVSNQQVKEAIRIGLKDKKDIKISKGVSGRGKDVPQHIRDHVLYTMDKHYPSIEFKYYLEE